MQAQSLPENSSKTPDRESPLEETHIGRHSSNTSLPVAPLPDHIGQNIEAIVALHTNAERNLPRHQRAVEAVTAFFGRPAFLYGVDLAKLSPGARSPESIARNRFE